MSPFIPWSVRAPRIVATLAGLSLFAAALPSRADDKPSMSSGLNYPATKKVDQVDDYHGTKVPDPYRWLEDLDSAETASWVTAQNKVTFGYLESIPSREAIKARLTKLWNFERYTTPYKEGGRYFYGRNDGLQNQNVLWTVDKLDGSPRVLLDPNTLSADGTVALGSTAVSEDGKLLAYALSTAGSDWQELRVRDVATGKDAADHLKWIKFSGASWTKDGKGFFYSRYDEPKGNKLEALNKFQKLYYHLLGTDQGKDVLVYKRDDKPDWGFGGSVTDDGRFLIISVWEGTERKNRVYYRAIQPSADARSKGDAIGSHSLADTVNLLDDFDAEYDFLGNDGALFYFRTDLNAPRGRIIAIDTADPKRAGWKELVPETKDTLQGATILNDQFVLTYLKDAQSVVKIHDLAGKHVRDVDLPGIGTASGFTGRRSDKETFYTFTSFTTPSTVYRYDLVSGRSSVYRKPKVDFNPDEYETKQVFYSSKDGTKIPMFLVHRKGLKLDGSNPTYLYGYGGFNIALTPAFSVANLVWMEMGGVYALANLRGGGEYGKAWHDAGRLHNKQNVFDDFIAAGEWLIANKYTAKDKLAIGGGSNGGLLVSACMVQRPDLFAAVMPQVPVCDMLRFDQFTIGWAWRSDYGVPNDPKNPESAQFFKTNMAYSPLHNVKAGTPYPATLITTGDHDDRVVPSHSFKFASALQAAQTGDRPVLIRIETKAGHGAGKPTSKIIEEAADRWAFLVKSLKMKEPAFPKS